MDQDTTRPDETPITDPPGAPAEVTPAEQTPPPPTEVQQPPDGSAPVADPVPDGAPAGPPPNETTADVTSPGDPGYDDLAAEAERQQQRARDLEGGQE
jgi:hypothetical protein